MRVASMLVALMSLAAIPAWAQDPVLVDSRLRHKRGRGMVFFLMVRRKWARA